MIDNNNILFLQTAHEADDDRVLYHQSVSLQRHGFNCHTISITGKDAKYKQLTDALKGTLSTFHAAAIICDTPLAVLGAKRTNKSRAVVIYDITEWYPSKKNLRNTPALLRPFKALMLIVANIMAGILADAFIFGETDKARPFRRLFPYKKSLLLTYYPLLEYITPRPANTDIKRQLRLLYAGPLTREKGYHRVIDAITMCARCQPQTAFTLTIITDSPLPIDQPSLPDNLSLNYIHEMPFQQFCSQITLHDIFFDLRDCDTENTRCLPIKLFYYMAAARPVIYSDLKAIRTAVPELAKDDCSLVNPDNIKDVSAILHRYLTETSFYQTICLRNRQLIENQYNWDKQDLTFISFIKLLI
ncbi:MAG: hypothetical protein IJ650_05085 [Paludibacteraceae bacterium]|nr:hypothetical protein [Paludibacteraceae bacterium]